MLGQCWRGLATLQAMTKRSFAAAWLIRWLAQTPAGTAELEDGSSFPAARRPRSGVARFTFR